MRKPRPQVAHRCSLLIGRAQLTYGSRDQTLLSWKILLTTHQDVSAPNLNPRRTIWACLPQNRWCKLRQVGLSQRYVAAHLPEARVHQKVSNSLGLSIEYSSTSHLQMAPSYTGLLSIVKEKSKIIISPIVSPSIRRLKRQRTNSYLRNALSK